MLQIFIWPVTFAVPRGELCPRHFWPEHPTLERWYLAFGLDYTRADGTIVSPPYPVLRWMWNSIKIGLIAGVGVLSISTISANAFSRIKIRGDLTYLDDQGLFLLD